MNNQIASQIDTKTAFNKPSHAMFPNVRPCNQVIEKGSEVAQ